MIEPENAAEELARKFHEAYERLAPKFVDEPTESSAVPCRWEDEPDNHKALMTAVAAELLGDSATAQSLELAAYPLRYVMSLSEGQGVTATLMGEPNP